MTQSRSRRRSGRPLPLTAAALAVGTLGALGLLGRGAAPALAVAGDRDPGFANAGVFLAPLSLGMIRGGYAVALQKDGRIVVAGYQSTDAFTNVDVVLWRLTAAGALDPTFNGSGFVRLSLPGYQEARAVAIDSRGRIVVAGYSYDTADVDFLVARFTAGGMLDSTLNGTGVVIRGIGVGTTDTAYGVAIQKDGKIVAAGNAGVNNVYDFALARFLPDGTLDQTFGGGDGLVSTDFGGTDSAYALALQKDGTIVLAGETALSADYDFALARYLRDGSLDPSFGSGGLVTTDFGGSEYAAAVAIQSDGRIVAAGETFSAGQAIFALARYQKNGRLDLSFDTDGKVTTTFNARDTAFGMAIQKDGKLVAAGATRIGSDYHFALARYRKNGNLDPNFGLAGRLVPFSPGSGANAVTIQKDGKIVTAGSTGATMAVVRYLGR
jgi:uncharacterized delta-60 repeat protein